MKHSESLEGFGLIRNLAQDAGTRIVLLVLDGVGGIPDPLTGKTALETAKKPNIDSLAHASACGRGVPVLPGITPGSGPGHLALFGYDPLQYSIGRGVLEALGVGMELAKGDVAARANFCTMDDKGIVTDRRAGRIPDEKCAELCKILSEKVKTVDGVKVLIRPGKSHRFVALFRGPGLSDRLTDADPQKEGKKVPPVRPLDKKAGKSAKLANAFMDKVAKALQGLKPANGVLLRGFSMRPDIPTFEEAYGLNAAAIATYPMYKGLARLVGMEVIEGANSIEDEISILEKNFKAFTFFYIHIKATDTAGEDGNLEKKVKAIEEVDSLIPRITALSPDVLAITGDHSTPTPLKSHSWHPVPVLIYSKVCGADGIEAFTEKECNHGSLGIFPMKHLMPLLLANAGRLAKYGA